MDVPSGLANDGRARRRRIGWISLTAGLVLVIGVPLGWQFRPLNAVERRLVGVWSTPSVDGRGNYLILGAGHRLTHGNGNFDPARRDGGLKSRMEGTWRATETSVVGRWRVGLITRLRNLWAGGPDSFEIGFQFEGPDTLTITTKDGRKIRWTRVSEQSVGIAEE